MRARRAGSNGRVRKSRRRAARRVPRPLDLDQRGVDAVGARPGDETDHAAGAHRPEREEPRPAGHRSRRRSPSAARRLSPWAARRRRASAASRPSRCMTRATLGRPPARRARARADAGGRPVSAPIDAKRASPELPAGGPEVDHQIAVDLPEPDHGARRERVEDHLGGQPRLHAGRARQHLRPGPRRDDHVGERAQRRRRRARDDDGPGAAPPPLLGGRPARTASRRSRRSRTPRRAGPRGAAGAPGARRRPDPRRPRRPARAPGGRRRSRPRPARATRRRSADTPRRRAPRAARSFRRPRTRAARLSRARRPPGRRPARATAGPPATLAAARRSSRVMVATRRSVESRSSARRRGFGRSVGRAA